MFRVENGTFVSSLDGVSDELSISIVTRDCQKIKLTYNIDFRRSVSGGYSFSSDADRVEFFCRKFCHLVICHCAKLSFEDCMVYFVGLQNRFLEDNGDLLSFWAGRAELVLVNIDLVTIDSD